MWIDPAAWWLQEKQVYLNRISTHVVNEARANGEWQVQWGGCTESSSPFSRVVFS